MTYSLSITPWFTSWSKAKSATATRKIEQQHDKIMTWKHFLHYWPWIKRCTNCKDAGDLRFHDAQLKSLWWSRMASNMAFLATCITGMSNNLSVMTQVISLLSHPIAPCANKFFIAIPIWWKVCCHADIAIQWFLQSFIQDMTAVLSWYKIWYYDDLELYCSNIYFHQICFMIYILKQRLVLSRTGKNHGSHYINQITWMLDHHHGLLVLT